MKNSTALKLVLGMFFLMALGIGTLLVLQEVDGNEDISVPSLNDAECFMGAQDCDESETPTTTAPQCQWRAGKGYIKTGNCVMPN